jgi:hypothetical protein
LFTLPPSEAVTDKVYFTIGVGVGASGNGLSFEQYNKIRNINTINLFIII